MATQTLIRTWERAHWAAGTVEACDVNAWLDGVRTPRPALRVFCQCEDGTNWTDVDLLDVLGWVRANRPDLLEVRP